MKYTHHHEKHAALQHKLRINEILFRILNLNDKINNSIFTNNFNAPDGQIAWKMLYNICVN
jgi:hypothetical protein